MPSFPTANQTEDNIADIQPPSIDTFIESISRPLAQPIIEMNNMILPNPQATPQSFPSKRKSTRLARKVANNVGKDAIQIARELLVKKLGDLSGEEKEPVSDEFKFYAQHFRKANGEEHHRGDPGTHRACQWMPEDGPQPDGRDRRSHVAGLDASVQWHNVHMTDPLGKGVGADGPVNLAQVVAVSSALLGCCSAVMHMSLFELCYLHQTSVEMATGTRNPSTRRVLPDKEAGME
jgi:hypothetical protein